MRGAVHSRVNTPDPQPLGNLLAQLFTDLPAGQRNALLSHAQPLTLRRDAQLLTAGSHWRDIFWLEQGALRMYFLDLQGAESNKNFYTEGALLWPITPTLRDEPIGFFIAALEPTQVWRMPFQAWQQTLVALPSWASLQTATLSLLLEDKMRREQAFLHCNARERYQQLLEARPQWADRIALRHLASYLGMTDVSLSRLRAELGLIPR